MMVLPAPRCIAGFLVFVGLSTIGRCEEPTIDVAIETVRVELEAVTGWVATPGTVGVVAIFTAEQRANFLSAMGRVDPDAVEASATVVRSGERASVDVVRKFPVPAGPGGVGEAGEITSKSFEMRNVGLMLAITPTVGATGTMDLGLEMTRRSLEGFATTEEGWKPRFGEADVKTAVTVGGGQSALLNLGSRGKRPEKQLTLVLITPAVAGGATGMVSDPKSQVEIEAKFVEVAGAGAANTILGAGGVGTGIFSAEQFASLIRELDQKDGIDLMSAPKVTTNLGRKAVINIVREFRYPTVFDRPTEDAVWTPAQFETRNTGVTLEVEPRADQTGRIDLMIDAEVVDFEGFIDYGAKSAPRLLANGRVEKAGGAGGTVINQPIFGVRRAASRVSVGSGETLILGGFTRRDEQTVESGPPAARTTETREISKTLLVFVTPRWVDSEGKVYSTEAAKALGKVPNPTPPPSIPVAQTRTDFPYGTPVVNKPGFVTSPHAPDAGYVDLRGFPPGTEVKCPYSGKLFLAP